MNYELTIYRHKKVWYWRIMSNNGKIVGASTSQGYSNRSYCVRNIYAVTGWNIKLRKEEKRSARIERVVIREKA